RYPKLARRAGILSLWYIFRAGEQAPAPSVNEGYIFTDGEAVIQISSQIRTSLQTMQEKVYEIITAVVAFLISI
ncbi:hypothetical protein, partial [Hungatella hathewayi]|uniref:hypothetical protein n=1 Tax=Hungatella hathewayi TaxID=154046 RepID=UPI001A98F483